MSLGSREFVPGVPWAADTGWILLMYPKLFYPGCAAAPRYTQTCQHNQTDVGRGKTSCDLVTAHPKVVLLPECAVMVSGMSEVLW